MAMRNWWIDGAIDGRATNMTGGPVHKDGGFILDIRQRDKGTSVLGASIAGYVDEEGKLHLIVRDNNNVQIFEYVTER